MRKGSVDGQMGVLCWVDVVDVMAWSCVLSCTPMFSMEYLDNDVLDDAKPPEGRE